jgi:hypothetical protein
MSYMSVFLAALIFSPLLNVPRELWWIPGVVYGILGLWTAAINFANNYRSTFERAIESGELSQMEVIQTSNRHLARCIAEEVERVLERRENASSNQPFDDPTGPVRGFGE